MRVLQLVTYPTVRPLHGGQFRVCEIRNHLERLGCRVETISISEPFHDAYDGEKDLIFNASREPKPYGLPFCTDLATARSAAVNRKIIRHIEKYIKKFKPEYFFLEQPWLWPALKHLIDNGVVCRDEIKIVYSSQNVEAATKRSILSPQRFSDALINQVEQEIYELEADLAKNSDYVIAVTQEDGDALSKLTEAEVLLCPNGVSRRLVTAEAMNSVHQFTRGRRYLLFVGSAYPPNVYGFWEMMGASLAALSPDEVIIVAGGVCDIILDYAPSEAKLYSQVNNDVLQLVGKVSDDLLAALLNGASGILVPITTGGGSNLKTAEAIAARRPVIATSMAVRGFALTSQLSDFWVHDDPKQFYECAINRVRTPVSHEVNKLTPIELQLRETVYWDKCLSNLRHIVERLKP